MLQYQPDGEALHYSSDLYLIVAAGGRGGSGALLDYGTLGISSRASN